MPCDSIQTSTVELLSKSTDLKLLQKALGALGYNVSITATGLQFRHPRTGMSGTYETATGKLSAVGRTDLDVKEIKRAYGKQIVLATAKQEGWQVTWATNNDGHEVASVEKAMY